VDEAGRGCMVGPLVVAGVSLAAGDRRSLVDLGVKDSKLLTPRRREALYPRILRLCRKVSWASIDPSVIDSVVVAGVRLRRLNYLEAAYFARVIDRLGATRATVDASDVLPGRFRDNIASFLSRDCDVVAAHKADRDFPEVSAASVVAKVLRDRAVERLKRKHGDFGTGYPSDPDTREFFTALLQRGEPMPGFVRKSWKTWAKLEQTLLDTF
jgi:ribonuclease HII